MKIENAFGEISFSKTRRKFLSNSISALAQEDKHVAAVAGHGVHCTKSC